MHLTNISTQWSTACLNSRASTQRETQIALFSIRTQFAEFIFYDDYVICIFCFPLDFLLPKHRSVRGVMVIVRQNGHDDPRVDIDLERDESNYSLMWVNSRAVSVFNFGIATSLREEIL